MKKKELPTKEEIVSAILVSKNFSTLMNNLGIRRKPKNINRFKIFIAENGIDLLHTNPTLKNINQRKYERIEKVCPACEKKFETSKGQLKEKTFCSRQCANKSCIHPRKIIKKTKEPKVKSTNIDKIATCKICSGEFIQIGYSRKKTCGISCYKIARKLSGIIAGRASASKVSKRSKNEILFHDLVKERFPLTLSNVPMFNGWDADVIIPELKIAVLWNGNWHHKKLTRKHSVLQVQNRDKIKIKEIEEFGYVPYVIDDFGKYNENFVRKEFDKFIEKFVDKSES